MILTVKIDAPTWKDRVEGREYQARLSRIAAFLHDLARAIELGQTGGTLERPGLVATYELQLPSSRPSRAA